DDLAEDRRRSTPTPSSGAASERSQAFASDSAAASARSARSRRPLPRFLIRDGRESGRGSAALRVGGIALQSAMPAPAKHTDVRTHVREVGGPVQSLPCTYGQGLAVQPCNPSVCCCMTGAGSPGAGHNWWL